MKAVGAPGEQESAVLQGLHEGFGIDGVVILAQGLSRDHAAREDDMGVVLVRGPGEIKQRVLARA